MNQEEHHEYQCRQFVIPIEVVELVERGDITIKMAWLLAVIDALYQSKGIGCFASEDWLAKRIQVKPRQLRNYLAKLIQLELILVLWKNSQKYLEAAWSNKESSMFGKKLPNRVVNKVVTSRQEVAKNLGNKLPIHNKEEMKGVNCRPPEVGDSAFEGFTTLTNGSSVPLPEQRFAQRLYKLLLANGKIVPREYRVKQWTTRFRQAIRDHGLTKVDQAMSAYEKHFDHQFMIAAYAANTFCDKIQRILDCATRIEQGNRPKTKKVYDHTERVDIGNGHTRPVRVFVDERVE